MPDQHGAALVVRDMRGRRRVELRDPSAATGNLGFRARGMPMVPEWDAESAVRWAYYANTIVYRCVQVTANALSRVPFRVGADPTRPNDFDRQAPLARLLGPAPYGPNSETSARQLWAWTVAQYLITGRFGWEVEQDKTGGRPLALWPLPASSLRPIPTSSGARYFDQFKFGPKGPNEKTLTAEQVVYGWRPSAHDWREPESALQAARMDVSVAVMQDRYDYAFLKNGARPDFMIVHEMFEDDDERDAFRGQFLSEHRGPDNAGKPAFVESEGGGEKGVTGAIDVKQLGLSQKDAMSIQRSEQKVRQICLALGTPLSKLGDASGRTFSNADQEDVNWYGETVQPLGDELSDVVNIKLAPRLGQNVGWFDWTVVPALRPARKFQVTNPVELVAAGIVDDSEVRDDLELPARTEQAEDADPDEGAALLPKAQAFAAFVGAGLTPASAALMTGLDVTAIEVQPAGPVVVPAPRSRAADPDFGGGVPLPTFADKPSAHSYLVGESGKCSICGLTQDTKGHKLPDGSYRHVGDHGPHAVHPPTAEDLAAAAVTRRDSRWKTVDARATSLEKTWQRSVTRMFGRQEKATIARLQGKRGRQLLTAIIGGTRAPGDDLPNADDIFDPEFWTTDTAEVAAGLYETVTAVAGHDVAERFGVAFDVGAEYVQEFIHARANQLAGQVTDTTYRAIQQALADGVAEGAGIDELAAAVRHVFDVASSSRAETIARTEVISAYNGAATLEAAQLPEDVVAGKEWVATRDSRVRDAHAEADGQLVAMADNFTVDGEDVAYPGDGSAANSINCRCTVTFLTPEDMPQPERARMVDERTARAAFRVVHAGMVEPDELSTRMRVVA